MQAECQAESDRDKERYRAELQVWRAANPEAAAAAEASRASKGAKAEAPAKPKKAPSAYILFLKDFRHAQPVLTIGDTKVTHPKGEQRILPNGGAGML